MSIQFNPDISENAKFPVTVPDSTDPKWVYYEEFVCALIAPMDDKDNIHHMATGVAGEGGELLDCSKKTWVYKKPLDRANMIEELGDLEWYMVGLRQMLGVSRHEVLAANVAKLGVRYANGYSDAAAIERVDKVETPLQVIDMSKLQEPAALSEAEQAAADSLFGNLSSNSLAEVPEGVELRDWVIPLLAAYHAGKIVQAIGYSKSGSVATVLFEGDSNPYKLYRPAGEV